MLKVLDDSKKVLRKKCEDVETPLSKENEKTILEMLEYVINSQDEEYVEKYHVRSGVGLAAPQIGISKKMIAIYFIDENDKEVKYALVNPKIVSNSTRLIAIKGGEGCLSVNEDKTGYVYRYYKITVKAYDALAKKEVTINAKGYEAIVLQHEIDHLSGILYYDRINKNNRWKNPLIIFFEIKMINILSIKSN